MIVQDFFETDMFIPSEEIDAVELSENVDALALNYPDDWPGAYWYGWLRWENAADSLKISAVDLSTYSSNDFARAFTGLQSPPQNFNVGYMSEGFSSYAQYWYGTVEPIQAFLDNGGVYHDPISDVSPFYGSRFINKLDPRGVCPIHGGAAAPIENGISIIIHLQRVLSTTDSCNNYTWDFVKFDGENEADGINKFLKGELTKTVTYSSFDVYDDLGNPVSAISINYTLDVNSPDFGVLYPNVWTTDLGDGYILNIFMCGYNYPVGMDRYNSEENYYYNTLKITPILSQNYNGVNYKTLGFTAYCNFLQYDDGVLTNFVWGSSPSMHSSTIIDSTTGLVIGGYKGTINSQPVNEHRYCMMFSAESNFAMVCENLTRTRIFRILSPEEIMHSSTLNMRYVTNDDYTYSSYGFGAGMFYPHISEENEYLCEWLTGDFEDIEDDLRPWQYGDITDNEYNPEDLPPYEPPAPVDDMYGDDITPPNFAGIGGTNGFITHYALTPSQMGRLGAALWAGVADNQFWDSIAVVLDNTLSINPADILNYIVAVRQYPMALQDTNACDILTLKDIYIGRGGYGLTVASDSDLLYHTIARMNRPVSLEYGGYLDITPFYNDFRDYEPCTEITLHVPFCGSCKLAPSQVVGKQLLMQYSIDYTSGSITAICNVRGTKTYPVAVMHGQIGANIQMSASETMDNLQNVAAIGAGVATFALNPAAGTAVMAGNAVATSLSHNHAQGYSTGRSGGFSAFFEVRKPYVIITHDVYETPQNFAHVYGNATNCEKQLGDLHGYTECENVDVSGLTCTADDAAIIKRLLESGVYMD